MHKLINFYKERMSKGGVECIILFSLIFALALSLFDYFFIRHYSGFRGENGGVAALLCVIFGTPSIIILVSIFVSRNWPKRKLLSFFGIIIFTAMFTALIILTFWNKFWYL